MKNQSITIIIFVLLALLISSLVWVVTDDSNIYYDYNNKNKSLNTKKQFDRYLITYKNGTHDTIKCERDDFIYLSNTGILEFKDGKIIGITGFFKIRE